MMSIRWPYDAGRCFGRACRSAALALRVAAVTCLVTACRDAVAPPRTVDVSVTVTALRGPALSEDENLEPIITCSFDLRADAMGTLKANWLDAVFRVYIGKNRTVPVDSFSLSAEEIVQSWGGSQIGGGKPQTSQWSITAGIPFTGQFEFRYRPQGTTETKRATAVIGCGPEPSPTAPPPTITSFSVTPSTGELAPGAPLSVNYTAAAASGLWLTGLQVSGPCEVSQLFSEKLVPSVTRSVSVPIPKDCRLGFPFSVRVGAVDVAAQQTTQTATPSVVIVDHEPPQIMPLFYRMNNVNARLTLTGDYFAGDSIRFQFGATDNHALAALVWEILPFGVKDSIVITGPGWPILQFAKLRPEWSGPIQLRLWARDEAGLTSTVYSSNPDSVRVLPLIDRPTRTASVAVETQAFAVDAARGLAYFLQDLPAQIAVVSLATLQTVSTIALPWRARDLDLTLSGDSLLLALSQVSSPQLGVVDMRSATPVMTTLALLPLEPGAFEIASAVRVLSNGHALVSMNGTFSPAYTLIDIDLATRAQRSRSDADMSGLAMLERSHDRSVLALNRVNASCLKRYVVATDAFSPCVQARLMTIKPSVDATGQRVALGFDVYDASLRLLPKVADLNPSDPPTALSADAATLFVPLGGLGFARLRANDNQPLDRTPLPLNPTFLWASPDGGTVLALENALHGPTKISVTDLR